MRLGQFAVAAMLLVGLAACQETKGPAQRAGESLDRTAEKVGDAIDPKGPVERAGRSVDRALGSR